MPPSTPPALRGLLPLLVLSTLVGACSRGPAPASTSAGATGGSTSVPAVPTAVLLVAHGSQSSRWRSEVESLAQSVRVEAERKPGVAAFRLAWVDAPRTSIAQAMREFDAQGVREVVVVPLMISAESSVTNDVLPFLIGMRSETRRVRQLETEGYGVYYPRARATLTPALGSAEVLKRNVLRRVETLLGKDRAEDTAVLLVGYGDRDFGQQMEEIVEGLGRYIKIRTPIDTVGFAFCGKLVDHSGEPVAKALNELFEIKERVLVVPVLLAVDEKLQINAIQAAINAIETPLRVRYAADAVLPDPQVQRWVLERIDEALARIGQAGGQTVPAPTRG